MKIMYRNPQAYRKNVLTVSEVAFIFDVSNRTVRNWIQSGKIKATNNGDGTMYLIPKNEIIRICNGEN